jgi:hypothetical protein
VNGFLETKSNEGSTTSNMIVGVMKDYNLKMMNLHASPILGFWVALSQPCERGAANRAPPVTSAFLLRNFFTFAGRDTPNFYRQLKTKQIGHEPHITTQGIPSYCGRQVVKIQIAAR